MAKKNLIKRWTPKKWKPDYDRIVAYRVMGKMNKDIAQLLGYTPEHVSTILGMPEAIELEAKLHQRLKVNIETNVPDVLEEISTLAAKRIKQLLQDDSLYDKSPFALIDRSIDMLKGIGHLRGGGNGSTGGGFTLISDKTVLVEGSLADQLREGLVKANEAKRLNADNTRNIAPSNGRAERAG